MKKTLALLLLLSTIAGTGLYAQTNTAEEELTGLLHNFLEGVSEERVHDRFWADDLIYTSSSGTRFGKEQIMAGFNNEESQAETPVTNYTAENIQIQVYDDMAVVAFRLVGKTETGDGIETNQFLNSGTFVLRNGQWKAVNWQATKVPDQPEN